MSKIKVSQFDKWFKRQFGHHPTDYRQTHEIENELVAARRNLAQLEKEWNDKIRCSQEYRAASYSRTASKDGFKF